MDINTVYVIKGLVNKAALKPDIYFIIVNDIVSIFPEELCETLTQLVDGPVHDGMIISKYDRDILIDMGIAIRVCCNGEQGFTGSRYIGYTILKAINEREDLRVAEQNEQAQRRYDAGILKFK